MMVHDLRKQAAELHKALAGQAEHSGSPHLAKAAAGMAATIEALDVEVARYAEQESPWNDPTFTINR